MVRTVTLVDSPLLKSVAIWGSVARLSRLMILVSRRWSRSCMIFSSRSDVVDLMFYRIPDIHGILVKWLYVKTQTSSLPRRCYVSSLLRRL
ncbi:hypothetical protein TNCV_2288301 [Trichonephila clavipes]|nr:hypothetical protein TNCV_2288301 [Trichonephila clavipes]